MFRYLLQLQTESVTFNLETFGPEATLLSQSAFIFKMESSALGSGLSRRGKRENYGREKVDPNAVDTWGRDGDEQKASFIKSWLQKQNRPKQGKKAK